MTGTVRELTVTRTFPVPRAAVFRAWTDPAELDWFLNPEQPRPAQPIEVDLRVGGAWCVPMAVDAHTAYTTGGIYLEIVPDERLVFAWGAEDGWPQIDREALLAGPIATVSLEDADGDPASTLSTFILRLPDSMGDDEARAWLAKGIDAGWRMTLSRLVLPDAGARPAAS